ncbi:hypothetical protein QN277_009059 [Acacia crassicarpa]|uniref:Uncharacterized protein n=1 Tax=Acacia crassicarpa TaxID=499986 RepID=A0AAE1IUI2_9FABA|nr:hypothetical protein QN277_009059 [Acacia crassicarpa]
MVTREEMKHRFATVKAEIDAKTEASFAKLEELRKMMEKMKEEIMMIVSTPQENNVPQAHSLSPIQSSVGSCCISGQSSEGGIQIAEPCEVGIRDYFGGAPRHSSNMVTREEMEHRFAIVKAEIDAKTEASFAKLEELKKMMEKMKEEIMMIVSTPQENNVPQVHSLSPIQSSVGSCCISGQSSEGGIQIFEPCDFFVEDPHKRLVTRGVSTTRDQLSTTKK